jgi:hypothetical protein
MNTNPFWLGAAVVCAVLAVFMPPGFNVVLAWAAYMYWKMSAL